MANDATLKGLRFARVIVWLVYALFIAAVVILVLAFFLLLFNASPAADFTQWVYRSADRVLQPFRGIFPTAEVGDRGSVIDFAILFAIIMYGIFAMVVHAVVGWLDARIVEQRWRAEAAKQAEFPTSRATAETGAPAPPSGSPPPEPPRPIG